MIFNENRGGFFLVIRTLCTMKKKNLSFKSLINSYIYPPAVYNLIISYNKAQQY